MTRPEVLRVNGLCVCMDDYDGPSHACVEGHHFRLNGRYENRVVDAIVNRNICPIYHRDEKDYDDGPCGAELFEIDCWHSDPAVIEEQRLEARGFSL